MLKPRVCPVLLFFGGLVKPGQPEVDYVLQGVLIKQCVLQRVDCRSPISESPECLLKPLPLDSEPGGGVVMLSNQHCDISRWVVLEPMSAGELGSSPLVGQWLLPGEW